MFEIAQTGVHRMRKKSVAVAMALAAVFGPLGLIYVSWAQALLGVVMTLVMLPMAPLIAPGSGGLMAYLSLWAIFCLVCGSMAKQHNQEVADHGRALQAYVERRLLQAEITESLTPPSSRR